MRADPRFLEQPKTFWANVRTISQEAGYTTSGSVKVPSLAEMVGAMAKASVRARHLVAEDGTETPLAAQLAAYFEHRASALNNVVEPNLMDAERACGIFEQMRERLAPSCPIPYNKQKGEKAHPAYLTGIVNMLVEANSGGFPVEYDPRKLTTVTYSDAPLRTFSRRLDGAFPSTVNPIAIWEIKEYYDTTTFGSRIADGVYETLLDGMELQELAEHEGVHVEHLLVVDAHYTWWQCGRSYLCRLMDMLHMGYVDEVLFGYEVIDRLPELVREWVEAHRQRIGAGPTPG